ncbi:MAG: hypothetical protein IJ820_01620 [Lachnospiraceae bacterium]|nr:hypothetical protein [Lachnospiraceae bacterium]
MITTQTELDVSPGGIAPVVHVSQYDTGSRTLLFNLIATAGDLVLPNGTKAEIRGTKPDGNGFSYECSISGKTVTADLTEQMTAAAGKAICEIVLYTGTPAREGAEASSDFTQLCTANFILFIERAALDKDTLKSGSEIRQLVTVIDRTDELLAAAQTMDDAQENIRQMTESTRSDMAQLAEDVVASAEELADQSAASARAAAQSALAAEHTLETVEAKGQQLSQLAITSDTIAREALEKATNAENESSETSNFLETLRREVSQLSLATQEKIDDAYVEDGFLYMTSEGDVVVGPLGPFSGTGGGGGGGTSGNNAHIALTNKSGFLSRTIAQGDSLPITINWTSEEDDIPTGNGTMKVTVGGVVKAMIDVKQGDVTVDVAPYVSAGTSVVKINVSDIYGNSRTLNFSITVVVLSLSSSFDDSVAYTGPISFPYTPVGNIQKTMHFLLDGREIGQTVTSVSGRQQSFAIPQQSHGAHSFTVYFDSEINGQTVKSNELYYEIICLEAMNLTPIVTCDFHTESVKQYTTIHIGYSVYNPVSMNADVVITMNGETLSTQTVGRTKQDYACRMNTVGTFTFVIASGEASRSFTLEVTESDIQIEAETEALALYLTSSGRSNSEENRAVWTYGGVNAQLSNFNFASDGWQKDEAGSSVLRVSGDARVFIPYLLFGSDFRTTGKTIELEFATRTVMDYDALILSCLSGGKGLSLTAQKVLLKSEQSEISMQFKENEHVRVAFVVEKRTENRLVLCYINGIMSGAIQYPVNDDFAQAEAVGISIGSNDCTIDLYNIRVYDNDLTRSQVLDNWIADTQDVEEMLERYRRNQVYDAYGKIVKEQLPSDLPYLILECAELPQYKGDKKTVSGSYTDPLHPEKSFTFTGAQFDVQGTSSQYYERKNYKGKYKNGVVNANGNTQEKLKLRDNSIPVATFCYKADVASSEGANNVELVILYNEACPYKTPAQREDERVRQGIDGFPIVIFWHDTVNDEMSFIGKYNANNDKSTEEVFGFQEDDESWEVRNNTSDRVLYKSADYSGDVWLGDFEARFPDTEPPYADPAQLQEFAEWIVSTDTEKATGDALPEPVTIGEEEYTHDTSEYRLAKFKAEAGDYMELDSAMFYYLFTELFLMVDSRAKNMFPSFMGTAIGGGE